MLPKMSTLRFIFAFFDTCPKCDWLEYQAHYCNQKLWRLGISVFFSISVLGWGNLCAIFYVGWKKKQTMV